MQAAQAFNGILLALSGNARVKLQPALRIVFLAAGCALFAVLLIRLGPGRIFDLLWEIGWWFLAILGIYFCFELVRALALRTCIVSCPPTRPPTRGKRTANALCASKDVRTANALCASKDVRTANALCASKDMRTANALCASKDVSYLDLLRIRMAGEAVELLTFSGPMLAEPTKGFLLRDRGLPWPNAFAATFCEYLSYSVSCALMAIAGLIYLLHHYRMEPAVFIAALIVLYCAAAFLVVTAIAIACRIYLIGAVANRIRTLPFLGRRIRLNPDSLRAMEDQMFVVLRGGPRRLVSILLVEFLANGCLVLELFVLLHGIGESFPALVPFLIESATKFINFGFFFIPGQIGAAEGIYAILFTTIGLPASAGFSLALARRLRNILVSAVGLIFLNALKRR
jgi:Lysylphosphatidylglycerol synthase TM region